MTQVFFQASGFTTTAITKQLTSFKPLLDPIPENAYGHWIFDSTSASVLTDIKNGKLLTAQDASPTYSLSGVTVNTAVGKALKTDFVSDVANNFTLAGSVKPSTVTGSLISLFGDFNNSGATSSAFGLAIINGYFAIFCRVNTVNSFKITTIPAVVGENVFASLSVNKATKEVEAKIMKAGTIYTDSVTYSATTTAGTQPLAIGNTQYTSSTAVDIKLSEFILFNSALSATDAEALLNRMKARAADRVIS